MNGHRQRFFSWDHPSWDPIHPPFGSPFVVASSPTTTHIGPYRNFVEMSIATQRRLLPGPFGSPEAWPNESSFRNRQRFFSLDHPSWDPIHPPFGSPFVVASSPTTTHIGPYRNFVEMSIATQGRFLPGPFGGPEAWPTVSSFRSVMDLSDIILPPIDQTLLNRSSAVLPAQKVKTCSATLKQSNGSRKDQHGAPFVKAIFPRRKAGKLCEGKRGPVILDEHIIRAYFHLPLAEAAYEIGISSTALKSACRSYPLRQESSLLLMSRIAAPGRKYGIKRWPYRFVNRKPRTSVQKLRQGDRRGE